jgi:transposase, IS5 family
VLDVRTIFVPTRDADRARDRAPAGVVTPTNLEVRLYSVIGNDVNDVTVGNALLHGDETDVFVDAGYQGAEKRPDATAGTCWHVTMCPSERRRWKKAPRIGRLLDYTERVKATVWAKVEHPFRVVKLQFGR